MNAAYAAALHLALYAALFGGGWWVSELIRADIRRSREARRNRER